MRISPTNPLHDSSNISLFVPPSAKPLEKKSELSIDDIVSGSDQAKLTATDSSDTNSTSSQNNQGASSWASREVYPVENTLELNASTMMPSPILRVEVNRQGNHRPPSVFYSILSKISTIGQPAVEKVSVILGVDTPPEPSVPGASRPTAAIANLSYHAVALGLKASDSDAVQKWKLLKTKATDWLCLIQPDWETASGIRITTVMSLGNQIRNTPELAGINTREIPLRRFIVHIRNMRRKSRARKKVN